MKKVLVLSGHPDLSKSLANQKILKDIKEIFPEVTVRDLSKTRVNGAFDLQAEHQALLEADVIVLQFPLYWYSVPALMKQYLDDVLTPGFAYAGGTALQGKTMVLSVTTGSPSTAYIKGESMQFSMDELLSHLTQSAHFCGMHTAPSVVSHGMTYLPGVSSINEFQRIKAQSNDHAARLAQVLQAI